ncbi:hypothetical protein [Mobiluncus mulieris]|nr:hypothetical protein [Mobiluncus mulieris]
MSTECGKAHQVFDQLEDFADFGGEGCGDAHGLARFLGIFL